MSKPAALPEPKAVIFDWDNTLVDTWPIIHAALNRTFEALGKPLWTLQETQNRVARSMRDSFPPLFGDAWQQAADLYQTHYRARHLEDLQPLPDAENLLAYLAGTALPLVVVSNKKGVSLRKEVAHLGWGKYFDAIVGADDAARDKPYPDPVHLALENTTLKAAPNVWFIGDSEVDLECAAATGCSGILYGETMLTHPEYSPTHYRGFPYIRHARDHLEMKAFFELAQARG